MTYEQAQAYMRRLSKEERRWLQELIDALTPRADKSDAGGNAKDKEKRKER